MDKLLIICVNYNSYSELLKYLNSINESAKCCNNIDVNVIIADNSSKMKHIDLRQFKSIEVSILNFNNKGYFGAAQAVMQSIEDLSIYDYVAISNVDLLLKDDFLTQLSNLYVDKDIAWLAPKIWSNKEYRDRNPKIINRYSKRRLRLINMMYKFPILDYLYTNTIYSHKAKYKDHSECDIYAGHGSFILLTQTFFKHYSQIEYPIFLFGEELYLAELIMRAGLRVHYYPKLVVYDTEHVSTGKMKKNFYYKCNKESIDYILKTFYNE